MGEFCYLNSHKRSHVEGRGYGGIVYIHFGTHLSITTTTATSGTFSTSFIVSTQGFGSRTITATDVYGSSAITEFKIIGRITVISPSQARVGEPITVEGTGYGTSGDTIQIDFGTHITIATTIIGNSNGTFSVTFLVSTQTFGSKPITVASIVFADNPVFITTAFTLKPKLVWSTPASGQVGSTITVFGTGFGSDTATETVRIDFGTHQTITTTTAGTNGTFSVTFLVSTQSYNNPLIKTITAKGLTSGEEDATPAFQIKTKIYLLSPQSGEPGRSITVLGSGYWYDAVSTYVKVSLAA